MKEENSDRSIHILAIFTSVIWGTTFASTKILIECGLSPAQIMLIRFLLAYAGIWMLIPKKIWADNLRDELWLFLAGMAGGSLYFFTENTALEYTYAANVAIVIAVGPLVIAFITHLFYKSEPFGVQLLYGGMVALVGIIMVVLNGRFILKISPWGDFLTLTAVLCWAFYSVLLKKLANYSSLFITRKVFFYGILTILPLFFFQRPLPETVIFTQPVVWGNLLFLGIVASLLCFLSWSFCVKKLGIVVCTNYLYLNPVAALAVSILVLGEPVTPVALLGTALILTGVYISEKKKKIIIKTK